MSEFKRFISYIYLYEDGKKSKNVGFAKIEYRNKIIKVWLSLKGIRQIKDPAKDKEGRVNTIGEQTENTVYMFSRKNGRIYGVRLGDFDINNGACDYKCVLNEDELHVRFEELQGMYMDLQGKQMLATVWDDEEFDESLISYVSENTAQEEQNSPDENEAALSATEETKDAKMVAAADSDTGEVPVWERPIKEVVVLAEQQSEHLGKAEENTDKIMVSCAGEAGGKTDKINVNCVHEAKENENKISEEKRYQPEQYYVDKVFSGREKKLLFCDDDINNCIDISPQDIIKLPDEIHHLMTNSFVNHGYFNFRHLMMGETMKNGKKAIVIGVPGIFNRREKMTANMFGFDLFKFSMRSDVHMNHFGYWLRIYVV